MKLIDVNVLIYSIDSTSAHHDKVSAWWNAAINGEEPLGFAWITLVGFLRISTNPRVVDNPLSITQSLALVESWLARPQTSILAERDDHWPVLRPLLLES